MVSLKPGDRVDCRLKGSNIVTAYNDYDEIRTFEIVAKDDEGYYLFVPCYLYTNGGSILDAAKARRMGIASRFIGEKITYIAESSICRVVHKMDGIKCDRCQDFFMMAEANQPGGGFICRSCRENPYR